MYLTNFDVEYRPHAVELTKSLIDLGFRVNRDGNKVVVISDNENIADNSLKHGNEFLNAKESVFESWVYDESDNYEEEIINPYTEYGLTQSLFF